MSVNYYPWNFSALINWLQSELSNHRYLPELAKNLKIQPHTLNRWLRELEPAITLDHIYSIAQYKGWSIERTTEWLEIKPAHWQSLVEEKA